jgi:hypothetical protein
MKDNIFRNAALEKPAGPAGKHAGFSLPSTHFPARAGSASKGRALPPFRPEKGQRAKSEGQRAKDKE